MPAFQRLGHGNEYEWAPPHLMHKWMPLAHFCPTRAIGQPLGLLKL